MTNKERIGYHMSIGQNIKRLRLRAGLSQMEFGELLGVSDKAVSTWENDLKFPRMGTIQKMAEYFHINKSDIIEDKGEGPIPKSEITMLPVVGRVAAGTGCPAQEYISGYYPASASTLSAGGTYFYLQVTGDSMTPKIDDGDLVLVRQQTSVDSGSLAVVVIDDQDGVVKKVYYGPDYIELHSFNPYYPVRRFDGPDVQRIQVCGLVKSLVRQLD